MLASASIRLKFPHFGRLFWRHHFGGCFDGVRPSYVLAGAVGWTKTASHVVHMFTMRNLLGGGHLGCQQVRGERALLFIHLFLTQTHDTDTFSHFAPFLSQNPL